MVPNALDPKAKVEGQGIACGEHEAIVAQEIDHRARGHLPHATQCARHDVLRGIGQASLTTVCLSYKS